MADLKSFRAWRPHSEHAKEVACVPYDVVNSTEAKELSKGKPNSFLHVIRPEIDLPENISLYDTKVYEKGSENLKKLLKSDFFQQEDSDSVYIYQLIMDGRSQTGIFGCVSVDDYNNDVILKHELTRPAKEDDRTKHIITQQAHAEPVMVTFRDPGDVNAFMNSHMQAHDPIYEIETEDGIKHTIWKVEETDELENTFGNIPKLYIADGHHRCASASRAAKEMEAQNSGHTGNEEYNFFPAVLFPMDQMEILAYNRIVYSIPNGFLNTLKQQFDLDEGASAVPHKKGTISLYTNGSWYGLTLPESNNDDVASSLDVARLQEHILEPLLGIKDQRTDSNIDFVGGIKGTAELESLVDKGETQLAISLYPTSIEELLDVSDAGLLMPPKSTWFEPKLRSGLLIHTF
ncbi:MAG: DUF1015 domain-containing protein [Balneolaceae bacterium]|nr:DUF1015 domain-containing protein [Balneolaceae bacterium]